MANMQMGLLARKLGMTQLFDKDGDLVPVTVLQVTPNAVLRVKKVGEKDGYSAVQVGFGVRRASRTNKALNGHAAKAGVAAPQVLRELRVPEAIAAQYTPGQSVGPADLFAVGEFVDITGISKGKGFAGVMKRHNFKGFINSHGNHEYFRHGGSIGTRLTPGMTLKGVRMPGHMGSRRTTVQNLKVTRVDGEANLLFVRGGVPGATGATLLVRRSVKSAARAANKAKK